MERGRLRALRPVFVLVFALIAFSPGGAGQIGSIDARDVRSAVNPLLGAGNQATGSAIGIGEVLSQSAPGAGGGVDRPGTERALQEEIDRHVLTPARAARETILAAVAARTGRANEFAKETVESVRTLPLASPPSSPPTLPASSPCSGHVVGAGWATANGATRDLQGRGLTGHHEGDVEVCLLAARAGAAFAIDSELQGLASRPETEATGGLEAGEERSVFAAERRGPPSQPPRGAESGMAAAATTLRAAPGSASDLASPAILLTIALALVAVPAWRMYHRLTRRDALDHPLRYALYEFVEHHPGATASAAARSLGIDRTTAEHHLTVLREFSLVETHVIGARSYLFKNGGSFNDIERRASVATRSEPARRIVAHLMRNPGARLSEIARSTGLRRSTVQSQMRRLRRLGIVDRERIQEPATGVVAARLAAQPPP